MKKKTEKGETIDTCHSAFLARVSNQSFYWVRELNILSDLVLQTKWKTEKKWNNWHLVNVIKNWTEMLIEVLQTKWKTEKNWNNWHLVNVITNWKKNVHYVYELNKKQKKGETIDTCHSAFLARK